MHHSELQAAFLTHFGSAPSHLVEAPGRVNLIGDHTDYNNLPVLPMALHQRVRLVVRPRDDRLVHIVPLAAGLEAASFNLAHDIPRAASGHWSNYVRGPAQAVARLGESTVRGFDAVVASDVPIAAGLSSSSALVVAVTLALLGLARGDGDEATRLNTMTPLDVASLASRAERYVGTMGGEMDHAASACGRAGHALQVCFAPLRVTPLPVPPSWRFVVAHSGQVAEKSGAREADYNGRVESCARALERLRGVVGGAQGTGYPALVEHHSEDELLRLAEATLHGDDLKRFRHTVTEAYRVESAVEALADGDALRFGTLMMASHASLATDYEVSTPLLDAMVDAAVAAGALGARITGAGFGGSVVALAPEATGAAVLSALVDTVAPELDGAEPTAFVAIASDGARVTPLRGL